MITDLRCRFYGVDFLSLFSIMEIKFTNHAKYRVLERNIKMSDIKSALKNPDYYGFTFDGKLVARKLIGDKTLEVIYTKSKNKILIITVYYL